MYAIKSIVSEFVNFTSFTAYVFALPKIEFELISLKAKNLRTSK